jgi:hypothetical protein
MHGRLGLIRRLGLKDRLGIGLGIALVLALGGCTTVDVARAPSARGGRDVFVSTADARGPYKSLGVVQATRRGVLLFGFADPAGTDIQANLEEQLLPQVRSMGGDGVINMRFEQTQYLLPTRLLFALLFFIPLPSETTITGEVIKLESGGSPGSGAAQPPQGPSL